MKAFRPQLARCAPYLLLAWAAVTPAGAQSGPLFPQAFVVEHQLIQTDGDGTVFYGDPVTDYYGGSWIVSVRGDESRIVVDLARREVSEVRPQDGTYWTIRFDRMAELGERMARVELGKRSAEILRRSRDADAGRETAELVVREPGDAMPKARAAGTGDGLWRQRSTRHLRVEFKDGAAADPALDVWVEPSVRLTPAALEALAAFEDALGSGARAPGSLPTARAMDAARRSGGGAFPVRTVRPMPPAVGAFEAPPADDPRRGAIEDVALRLETLDAFPLELVEVPDGLRQVPHPLENVVAFMEKDLAREIPGAPDNR